MVARSKSKDASAKKTQGKKDSGKSSGKSTPGKEGGSGGVGLERLLEMFPNKNIDIVTETGPIADPTGALQRFKDRMAEWAEDLAMVQHDLEDDQSEAMSEAVTGVFEGVDEEKRMDPYAHAMAFMTWLEGAAQFEYCPGTIASASYMLSLLYSEAQPRLMEFAGAEWIPFAIYVIILRQCDCPTQKKFESGVVKFKSRTLRDWLRQLIKFNKQFPTVLLSRFYHTSPFDIDFANVNRIITEMEARSGIVTDGQLNNTSDNVLATCVPKGCGGNPSSHDPRLGARMCKKLSDCQAISQKKCGAQ